jgi:hypothetical protein
LYQIGSISLSEQFPCDKCTRLTRVDRVI